MCTQCIIDCFLLASFSYNFCFLPLILFCIISLCQFWGTGLQSSFFLLQFVNEIESRNQIFCATIGNVSREREKKESEARRGENKGGEKSGEEEEEGEGEEEEGEEEEEEEEGSTLHILCRLFCPLLHCDA